MTVLKKTAMTLSESIVLIIAALLGVTCSFGVDMHCPSLPAIVQHFHASVNVGQASVTTYLMSMMVCQLFYGPASDRLGRKPMIILGLFIAIIGTVACLGSTSITVFLIGRTLQGMGAAVGMSLGRAILNDVLTKEQMVVYGSYVALLYSMGLLIGPLMGGYAQALLGWRGPFYLMGVFFILDGLIVGSWLKETLKITDTPSWSIGKIIGEYGYLLSQPLFIIYSLCAGIGLSFVLTFSNMASFIVQQHYGQSAIVYGWVGACVGSGSFLGKLLCSRCVHVLGIRRGVRVGMRTFLLFGILLMVCQSTLGVSFDVFVAAMSVANLGLGFIFSNSVAGALSNYKHMSGTAGAMYGAVQNGVAFLVSLIIGLKGYHSLASLSVVYVLLGALGCTMLFILNSSRSWLPGHAQQAMR